ncbi:HNH endonuclease signature motif containing protein [Pseudomonas sp. dw_358]|uniref:HNH endonuclease signature motif containing protein n=1 Tax=Pseudomonas sp. dw_358 TaxID=2720083 RepID=UPI001BD6BDA3|nr:HNH endonuclease signature motif containing protein [Pseudomonas sp. dw_358]
MRAAPYQNLVKYGVPSNLADKSIAAGLTVTNIRATSQKTIVGKYGMSKDEAIFLKKAVMRQPIDSDTVQTLLERSNFRCCVCKGDQSAGFVIHHIVEYEKTQDNDYDNLIVLCPNDHDRAHQGGLSLTISESNLRQAKEKWEQQVEIVNAQRAARSILIRDDAIDYINVNRIEELCVRLFGEIPQTTMTSSLQNLKILDSRGSFNQKYVETNISGGQYLFDYVSSHEAEHYRQLMTIIATKIDFADLDPALPKTKKLKSLEGYYVYFTGGVSAKGPILPFSHATPPITMRYSKRKKKIEWHLEPKYLMSISAIARIGGTNRYTIYCLIRSVSKQENGEILITASPLLIAQPMKYIDKTPIIAYARRDGPNWIRIGDKD